MKTFLFLLLFSGVIYSQTDTIFYLPESAEWINEYLISTEIFGVHTRFEPPPDWNYYKVKEIHFLFSTMILGDTIKHLGFYKDTLQTLIHEEILNLVIDSTKSYPNWHKIIINDFPVISGIIEVPVHFNDLFSLCIADGYQASGHTIGFYDASQSWGVTIDYPIKLVIERSLTDASGTSESLITDYILYQNYPNPFNPSTTINYSLAQTGRVTLSIYDLLGREVVKLIDEEKPAGEYETTWNATAYPSGIYFLKMQAGQFSETRKLILVK